MLTTDSQQFTSAASESRSNEVEAEDRRIQRILLPLPTRVEVKVDAKVCWNEITRLDDVSAFGAGVTLKRPIKRGRLVLMTIPMPRQLRAFDHGEPQYKVWGTVRRCIHTNKDPQNPAYAIGIAFIGQHPPANYYKNPSQLYDISHREEASGGFWKLIPADLMSDDSHLPKDDRKQTRFSIPETLIIQRVDENGDTLEAETTVSENISFSGAAVMTSLNLEIGTFLRVTSERSNITILSVVRGTRVGADGIPRVHLEFIDQYFPLEGID